MTQHSPASTAQASPTGLSGSETAQITHEFCVQQKIHFADCDPCGIVFFPQYFVMLNRVLEDWFSHLGIPWTELMLQRRMGVPTAHLHTDFLRPSQFGDVLNWSVGVAAVGKSSLHVQHRVDDAHGLGRVRIHQRLVATSLDNHRPVAWPADVRQALVHFKEKVA